VAITGTRRRWFRERTRSAIQRSTADGGAMFAGTAVLDAGGTEFLGPAEVGAAVQNLIDAHRRLLADDATAELLAVDDPDPVVRLHAVRDALPRAEPAWIRARADDADPRVALAAAEGLGDEGVPRIRALLASTAALDAVRALAPRVEVGRDPEVDAALGRLLERPTAEAVALAGRLGGIALVAPLLRIGGDHRAAARDAVRAIQGRALGERGGVSIAVVPPESGALSAADDAGGALSGAPAAEPPPT
jgi:hypothetical protein